MSKLQGLTAIVTGGGGGIGGGISCAFANEGSSVAVLDVALESARRTVDRILSEGGSASAYECDVSDRSSVEGCVKQVEQDLGWPTILVNAAQGFGAPGATAASPPSIGVEDMPDDVWDNTFNTGVKGTLNMCRAVFPSMRRFGAGKIINFGSAWGQMGMEGGAAYNANKEAIRGLSRTMAREWGPIGINVNVINPLIETTALRDQAEHDPERVESWLQAIPKRRFGTPEDAGSLAVFLVSSDSDYITGRTFMLDGGRFLFA